MLCPYCSQQMHEGKILGDRYQLKWMPNDKKMFMGIWATSSIKLGKTGLLSRPSVDASFCGNCKKMVIDVQ